MNFLCHEEERVEDISYMDMESTSMLNTSLELNCIPLPLLHDAQPRKPEDQISNYTELRRNLTLQQQRSAVMEELNRVNAENKKLEQVLTVICHKYTVLMYQFMEDTNKNHARKRKAEATYNNGNNIVMNGASGSTSSNRDSSKKPREQHHVKANTRHIHVQADVFDTSLRVKDGYHWKKYGQKVTMDNPFPRAYFKCSFAPACPVKKKVQRSTKDPSIVVATYEGEHNHSQLSKPMPNSSADQSFLALGNMSWLTSPGSSRPPTTDFTEGKAVNSKEVNSSRGKVRAPPEFQPCFVEQMASTLTRDPSFRAALAAAISVRFL